MRYVLFLVEQSEKAVRAMTEMGFEQSPRLMALADGVWLVYHLSEDLVKNVTLELAGNGIVSRTELSRVA